MHQPYFKGGVLYIYIYIHKINYYYYDGYETYTCINEKGGEDIQINQLGHLSPSQPSRPNTCQSVLTLLTSMRHNFWASDLRNGVDRFANSCAAKIKVRLHFRYCSGVRRNVEAIAASPGCSFSKYRIWSITKGVPNIHSLVIYCLATIKKDFHLTFPVNPDSWFLVKRIK